DRRRMHLAEDLDLQTGALRGMFRPHHGERQALAHAPAIAAMGGAADKLSVPVDRLRAARIGVRHVVHFERDVAPSEPLLALAQQCLTSDEVPLVEMHEAVEPAFPRSV